VKRQFGQITDAAFDRLEPYLEHEFRGRTKPQAGRQLDSGRALLLIDGVDELLDREFGPQPFRHARISWLSLFGDDLCIPQGMHVLSALLRLTHLNLGP
jgi:hypothetical protein